MLKSYALVGAKCLAVWIFSTAGWALGVGEEMGRSEKKCKPGKHVPTATCAVSIAKKEIVRREKGAAIDEPVAVEANDGSGWIITATRLPAQPGGYISILISKRGQIVDYRGGM
jgi:hypothetical protein